MIQERKIPRHVAIIMDGNGRWAEQRGEERYVGHMQGVESVRRAVKAALRNGVEYLTLYAFSTENWGRPAEEVNALMEILCKSIVAETPELKAQGVRVRMIGDRSRFSERVRKHLAWTTLRAANSCGPPAGWLKRRRPVRSTPRR